MTRLYKAAAAAIASLALIAGATAASAQTFTQAGQAVTARGVLTQNVSAPGVVQTTCSVEIYGTVASNGSSITFTDYNGVQVGSTGNLACDDSLEFNIVATPVSASVIELDQFVVGTRAGPCQEFGLQLPYSGNVAQFDNLTFGLFGLCYVDGDLTITTDAGNDPVLIQ